MMAPPDDLKRIRGIGLATESRLKAAGITTFVKLSRLTPSNIARIVPGRSAVRIARESWIGQARKLASGRSTAHRRRTGRTEQGRQHYATFTVELLLNDDNTVQRTRIKHVQSGNEKYWSSWKKTQLADFFVQQGQLKLRLPEHEDGPMASREQAVTPKPKRRAQAKPSPEPTLPIMESIYPVVPISSPERISPVELTSGQECSSESEDSASSQPAASSQSFGLNTRERGMFRIGGLDIIAFGSNIATSIVLAGQKFNVRFVMNLTEVTRSFGVPLAYVVNVWAKKLGGKSRLEAVSIGRDTIVMVEDEVPCSVEALIASVGTYRLWVEASLTPLDKQSLPLSPLPSAPISKLLQVC